MPTSHAGAQCYDSAKQMSLANKVAVVTGAAAGIGRAIAFELGRQGSQVGICDLREEPLIRAAEEMKKDGVEVFSSICDVSDRDQVDRFIDSVMERYERVDILVNNAAICPANPIDDPEDDTWRRVLATNLDGVFYCTRRALGSIPDGGRVINISSISGKTGDAGYTAYCASKHAVIGFTRALALEVAPRRITVNAVCPGWTDTEMARHDLETGARQAKVPVAEFRSGLLGKIPLAKIIEPSEVAELVLFLASPAAANITGQAVNISGGLVMS